MSLLQLFITMLSHIRTYIRTPLSNSCYTVGPPLSKGCHKKLLNMNFPPASQSGCQLHRSLTFSTRQERYGKLKKEELQRQQTGFFRPPHANANSHPKETPLFSRKLLFFFSSYPTPRVFFAFHAKNSLSAISSSSSSSSSSSFPPSPDVSH